MRRRVLCGIVLMVCLAAALAPGVPVATRGATTRPVTAPATRPTVARPPATAPARRPLWPIPTPPPPVDAAARAAAAATRPAAATAAAVTRPASPATQPAFAAATQPASASTQPVVAASATQPASPATQPVLASATQPAFPATQPNTIASATTQPATTQPLLAAAIVRISPPTTRPFVKVPTPLPDRPLSMDELQSLFVEARYPDLLKSINRVLALKGKAADPYDRYEVLALKAETHLRMKAIAAAILTFTQMAEETKDPQQRAVAKASVVLLKKSRNLAYTPTSGGRGKSAPIDLVDPASRRKALRQLLADELALATPKVEKALDGRSLAAVAEALRSLQGIDVLERAAEGDDQESKQISQELRDRGNAVMAKALQQMSKAVEEISKSANEMQEIHMVQPLVGGGSTDMVRYRKRGLSRDDVTNLKAVIATCEEIAPNATGLARATGGKEKDIENLVDAADDLARRADKVLKAEYR